MKTFRLAVNIALLLAANTFLTSFKPEPAQVTLQKPNILFILTDDQRADALGAMGNPYIKTPHLDEIASQGVLFKNTHIMGANHGAVCAPSRAMLLSGLGLYNVYEELGQIETEQWEKDSLIGIFRPFKKALNDQITFPQWLKKNGYSTFGTGKWHGASRKAFSKGFSHGKDIFFGGMANHFRTPFTNMNQDGSFSKSDSKGFSTDIITDAAIDFIADHAAQEEKKPFLAFVSYTAPHDPRSPAQDYTRLYGDNILPVPPNLEPRHPFGFEGGRVLQRRPHMVIRDETTGAWPRTAKQIRKQLADYYGLITHLDDAIGRLLENLKKQGVLNNTIIIFTSDNGLALGSHGLLGKQSLYEHCTRVPLIIAGPGIPENSKNESLVNLLDIFPTLCDLTGIHPPETLDGKNLMPVITGKKESVRKVQFTTYYDFIRAVRTERWKLITYPLIHHIQLFDLQNDPFELNNLAEQPQFQNKLKEMMELLKAEKQKAGDHFPIFTEKKWSMDYSVKELTRKPDFHQPEYIIERYFKEK